MKIKVAIIDHLGAHGSSHHFYLFGQAIGLINSGVDVSLYTNSKTHDPKIKQLKFFQFYKDIFLKHNKFLSAIRYLSGSVFSHLHAKKNGCKVFHYHIFGFSVLVLFNMLLAKICFGKIVLTIHDVRSFANPDSSKIYTKLIYALTDKILTHNNYSKHEIIKYHTDIEHKINVIPHGNYLPFIIKQVNKKKSRKKIGLDTDGKVILFFGMIKKVKCLDLLLKAMPEVIKENEHITLLIAGKPWKDDFSNYQQIIDELSIAKSCVLHINFINHEDVEHYYCASDLVVLPYSKIYQSGVLMMSLSYGKPVVLSDLEAFKEVVEDHKHAFFFVSGNKKSLSEIIIKALNSPVLLDEITSNGLALMENSFSWDKIGAQTKAAYLKINYFYKGK